MQGRVSFLIRRTVQAFCWERLRVTTKNVRLLHVRADMLTRDVILTKQWRWALGKEFLFSISSDSSRNCFEVPVRVLFQAYYECEIRFWNVLYFTRNVTSHDEPHQEMWGWHKTRQQMKRHSKHKLTNINILFTRTPTGLSGRGKPAHA